MGRSLVPGFVLLLVLVGGTAAAEESRLPEPAEFAREVRARLQPDRDLLSRYSYIERREEVRISRLGEVDEGPVKVYEVHPGLEPGNTYKRLIEVDGEPLSTRELEKADRKHQDDLRRERDRRARESAADRTKRLEREADERREREAVLDEIFDAFDIELVGRDTVAGHPTIVATLEPRADHRPRTDQGKLMKKLRVRAWVSERDYQIAKVEAEVIEDITVGWGILGRLHKGARAVFERKKVNDEIWLPWREVMQATGRTLLFRTFDLHTVTEYSDYRREK